MATRQDLIDAIAALEVAETAHAAASVAFNTANDAVDADLAAENTVFSAAIATYETARNAVRTTHGYDVAFAALEAAVEAHEGAAAVLVIAAAEYQP